MARPSSSPERSVTRKVAFELHGMRPRISISPVPQQLDRVDVRSGGLGQFIRGHGCPSGSIGRPQNRQLGRPAETISSANAANADGLAAGEVEPEPARVGLVEVVEVDRFVVVLVVGIVDDQLLEHHHEAVEVGVVGQAHGPDDEGRVDRRDELERFPHRQVVGIGEVLRAAAPGTRPRALTCCFSHFKVTRVRSARTWTKNTRCPGCPTAPGGEGVDVTELVQLAHRLRLTTGRSSASEPPVELTDSTIGPPSV